MKLGAEGALWTDGGEQVRASGGAGVSAAVDSTGAGDAFAAGLLAARIRGAAPAEALAAGCELAARAVGHARAPGPRRRRSGERGLAPAAAHEPRAPSQASRAIRRQRHRQCQHPDQHAREADQQVAGVVDRVVERAAHAPPPSSSSPTSRLTVTTA